MTIAQWVLRVAVVLFVLGAAILLSPPFDIAPTCDTQTVLTCADTTKYVIPDEFWQPMIAIVNLNEWFPVVTMATLFVFDLTLRAAMVTWWLAAWAWGQVRP